MRQRVRGGGGRIVAHDGGGGGIGAGRELPQGTRGGRCFEVGPYRQASTRGRCVVRGARAAPVRRERRRIETLQHTGILVERVGVGVAHMWAVVVLFGGGRAMATRIRTTGCNANWGAGLGVGRRGCQCQRGLLLFR